MQPSGLNIYASQSCPENARSCRWCAPAVQPGRVPAAAVAVAAPGHSPCGLVLRGPLAWRRKCGGGHFAGLDGGRDPGGRGAAGPRLGPGDVGARGGADLGPQSRGPAASGHGRSVVMKKRAGKDTSGVERAAPGYLNGMPEPVVPRLLGADAGAGILLMEDLGPGPSLAGSLPAGGRSRVRADLVSDAGALGSMHAWSMGRPGIPASVAAASRHVGLPRPSPGGGHRSGTVVGCSHDGCPGRLDRCLGGRDRQGAGRRRRVGHDHDAAPAAGLAAQPYVRAGPFGRASRPWCPGRGLHERLSARWPEAVIAAYPALARPGSAQVQVPDFWQPEV